MSPSQGVRRKGSPQDRVRRNAGWRPVAAPTRPVVFINPRSGGGTAVRLSLAERATELGIEPIVFGPSDDLAELVAGAVERGADALAVAGGDGSLAVVAEAAARHALPFACIPAGTRNHFARDLGVRRHDVIGALEAFSHGLERRIDVGDVDGRLFLDNVVLGVYGDAVAQPGYRDARVRTLLAAAQAALGPEAPASGLSVVDDQGRPHHDPAVVLVSNNPYALERSAPPDTRPRLDTGRLGVIVADRPAPRRRPPARSWSTESLVVASDAPIRAGVDGEAMMLTPPLHFLIRPLELRVRIAAGHPGASPSAQLGAIMHRG